MLCNKFLSKLNTGGVYSCGFRKKTIPDRINKKLTLTFFMMNLKEDEMNNYLI